MGAIHIYIDLHIESTTNMVEKDSTLKWKKMWIFLGSKAEGDKVVATIGVNLNMES